MSRFASLITRERVNRLTLSFFGAVAIGAGAALGIRADLGVTTFNALTTGLNNTIGITVGVAATAVAIVMVVSGRLLGVAVGVGAIAGIIVPSVVVDIGLALLAPFDPMPVRLVGFLGGFVAIIVGATLMVRANIGMGPVEALMIGLRRFGISITVGRTAIEIVCVAAGFLMGGVVGLGTIVYVFATGPILARLLKRWPPYTSPF